MERKADVIFAVYYEISQFDANGTNGDCLQVINCRNYDDNNLIVDAYVDYLVRSGSND